MEERGIYLILNNESHQDDQDDQLKLCSILGSKCEEELFSRLVSSLLYRKHLKRSFYNSNSISLSPSWSQKGETCPFVVTNFQVKKPQEECE